MTSPRRILVAALVGVAASTSLLVAPSTASTPVTYHQRDSGRTVHVRKGHSIRIVLRTATDGGYSWVVTRGAHSSKFTESWVLVMQPSSGPTPIVGGDARTVFTLKATHAGTATFTAVEKRPFEPNSVIKRFTLHLIIRR